MTGIDDALAATRKDAATHGRCRNPHCRRKVKHGVAYCCTTCATAHEDRWELEDDAPEGTHPLLRHTGLCDARREERGLWDELWIGTVRPAGDGRFGRLGT